MLNQQKTAGYGAIGLTEWKKYTWVGGCVRVCHADDGVVASRTSGYFPISLQKSRHDGSKRFRADRKTKTNEVVYWQSLRLTSDEFSVEYHSSFQNTTGINISFRIHIKHLSFESIRLFLYILLLVRINKIRIDMTLGIHRRGRLRFDTGFDFRMFWFSFFREKLEKLQKLKKSKKISKKN